MSYMNFMVVTNQKPATDTEKNKESKLNIKMSSNHRGQSKRRRNRKELQKQLTKWQ